MYDKPDIIIKIKNGSIIVVDAKHIEYIFGKYKARRQIDDYMEYAKAAFGVLIFSHGDVELWDELVTTEGNRAAWTTLTPSLTGDKGATNQMVSD
jgi:hypothetical protein